MSTQIQQLETNCHIRGIVQKVLEKWVEDSCGCCYVNTLVLFVQLFWFYTCINREKYLFLLDTVLFDDLFILLNQ